jgi:ClpP class serine protease
MNLTTANRLWAISPTAFLAVQKSLQAAAQPEAFLTLSDFVVMRPEASMGEDGVGHVHVSGALGDKMPAVWGKLGNTDYRQMRDDIAGLMAGGAETIALHIDSPGGMVIGLEEAGAAIAKAAESAHVVAVVDGMACSAAYYLACQADEIHATPSSEVGNIGTVLAWADEKPAWEAMGVEFHVMTNEGADLKGTFRDSPMSESQREFLQESLNEHGAAFRAVVEGNRPDIDEEVFRAGWYSGEKAQALGLIDTITRS